MDRPEEKILLIEDNPGDAALFKELLGAGTGIPELILGSTLADGIAKAAAVTVSVVFLDLSLPDSHGLETVLTAVNALRDVPIVVLTGMDDDRLGLESLRAGAQDYLSKGKATTDSILRTARYAIERQRILRDLHEARHNLEDKVKERTADLARTIDALQGEVQERQLAEGRLRAANEQLNARAGQLRALAGELTLVEQRERQRMAKLLHDHLQQLLVGAKFRVSILGRAGDDVVKQAVTEIEELLGEAIGASRSLTAELSPPILHEEGLSTGLEWLTRWMADKHGLFVDLAMEAEIPRLVEHAKILLFESVRELLFNAVKHAHVHSVRVNVRQIQGTTLQITVSDDGPGFDPSRLKMAGEVGGGFGLFSIRERLDLIGGRMDIISAPGKGSRFVLLAPLGQAPAAPEPLKAEAVVAQSLSLPVRAPSSRYRILLADDHAVMRDGLSRLLGQEADIEIVGQASDGKMAVELARKLKPDVILMDLSMPKISGIDATRIIHEEAPQIKIIGLSMFDEVERAQTMFEAGAVAYLSKSAPSQNIILTIRGCMKGQLLRDVAREPPTRHSRSKKHG